MKIPHKVEVEWDLRKHNIPTLGEEGHYDALKDLGLPLFVTMPDKVLRKLAVAKIEDFPEQSEVIEEYLTGKYSCQVHNLILIDTVAIEKIPLDFQVTVRSARLPSSLFSLTEYIAEILLLDDLKTKLRKYYGLSSNVKINNRKLDIGFKYRKNDAVRTLNAVFHFEGVGLTPLMAKRINRELRAKADLSKSEGGKTNLYLKLELSKKLSKIIH